jgi:hypothetical protein
LKEKAKAELKEQYQNICAAKKRDEDKKAKEEVTKTEKDEK